jgi:hypothetical protein
MEIVSKCIAIFCAITASIFIGVAAKSVDAAFGVMFVCTFFMWVMETYLGKEAS